MKLNKNFFKMSTPLIMGVCNITKDSFSDGGKYYKNLSALDHIKKMYKNSQNNMEKLTKRVKIASPEPTSPHR